MARLLPKTLPEYLRRLVPAALLAATAMLGGSAMGHPATACAKPKKPFNQEGYSACVDQVITDWKAGQYTDAQKNELVRGCCNLAGGKIDDNSGACVAAESPRTDLPSVTLTPQPVITQPGVATQTLEPAQPPIVRNPGAATETITPAPAG